jgi:hypothetical protein
VHTFWLLAVCVLMGSLLLIAIPFYTLLAMRRVYGGRWGPRLLRGAFLGLTYALLMLCMFVFVTLVAVLV